MFNFCNTSKRQCQERGFSIGESTFDKIAIFTKLLSTFSLFNRLFGLLFGQFYQSRGYPPPFDPILTQIPIQIRVKTSLLTLILTPFIHIPAAFQYYTLILTLLQPFYLISPILTPISSSLQYKYGLKHQF